MACMSRISVRSTPRGVAAGRRAFTLTEVMVAVTLSAIVMVAILSAYLFVGRNLTRLMNMQGQEVDSRRALRYFAADVSAASAVTVMSAASLTLTKVETSGSVTVSYTYAALDGTLIRTQGTNTLTLFSDLTSFAFTYYNDAGSAISSSPHSVKAVEFLATASSGTAATGTLSRYTSASPRVVLRNKQALQ